MRLPEMDELGAAGGGRAERLPEVDELSGCRRRATWALPVVDELGAGSPSLPPPLPQLVSCAVP